MQIDYKRFELLIFVLSFLLITITVLLFGIFLINLSNYYTPFISTTTEQKSRGDLNGDNKINIEDLNLFRQYFTTNDLRGDINSDGKVDIGDLSILSINWQK